MTPQYAVVAAAICRDGRVLAGERAYPAPLAGRWELPGGKVEPGETDAAALRRECAEELAVEITVGERVGPAVPTVDGKGELRAYLATISDGATPRAHEHASIRWLSPTQLPEVAWLDADWPIVHALIRHLGTAVPSPE